MYERERPQISEKIGIIKETEEDFQNFSSTSKKFENTLSSQNKNCCEMGAQNKRVYK